MSEAEARANLLFFPAFSCSVPGCCSPLTYKVSSTDVILTEVTTDVALNYAYPYLACNYWSVDYHKYSYFSYADAIASYNTIRTDSARILYHNGIVLIDGATSFSA